MHYPFYRAAVSAIGGLPLDILPEPNIGMALVKIRSTYLGDCVRVRRSSDNTFMDIGFDGVDLDRDALLAFVGSGDGFVHTWYDQGTNANDFVNNDNAFQPRLVVNGEIINHGIDFQNVQNLISSSITIQSEFTLVINGGYNNYVDFDTLFLSQNTLINNQDLVIIGGAFPAVNNYQIRYRLANGIPSIFDSVGLFNPAVEGDNYKIALRGDAVGDLEFSVDDNQISVDIGFNPVSRTNAYNVLGSRFGSNADNYIKYFYIFDERLTDEQLLVIN